MKAPSDTHDSDKPIDEPSDDGPDGSGQVLNLSLDTPEIGFDVPSDATPVETAAIASAIGAHLIDERRMITDASDARSNDEDALGWTLTGRLRSLGKRRIPRNVKKGEEWQAAARSFPR